MKLLQFSGGIDSLACLWLLRNEPGLEVITLMTDGAYASTRIYLGNIKEAFPGLTFHTCHTSRNLEELGYPVDVVPLRYTGVGQLVRGGTEVRYQDFFSCCRRSIWMPLEQYSLELKPEVIYRGQRNDDRLKAPFQDGYVEGGVEYRLPIATWTREMVRKYVDEQCPHLLPPGYDKGERTSRDCIDCTAYLQDNGQRIRNLPEGVFKQVTSILTQWRLDVRAEMGE